MMRVLVDNRERGLRELPEFMAHVDACANLDVGDVCFVDESEAILLTIERKTLCDLAESIKDGRYREQKHRLLGSLGRDRVMYVIEGALHFRLDDAGHTHTHTHVSGIPLNTLCASVINTMVRDGIRVVSTADLAETAAFVTRLVLKARKDGPAFFMGCGPTACPPTMSTKKKASHTPVATFRAQLCAVPGVSGIVADAILKATGCSSMKDFCARVSEADLADVKLASGNRRVGPAVAKRVAEHCFGCKTSPS